MDIAMRCRHLGLCIQHYNSFYLVIDLYFKTSYVVSPLMLLPEDCFRTVLLKKFSFLPVSSPVCSVVSVLSYVLVSPLFPFLFQC